MKRAIFFLSCLVILSFTYGQVVTSSNGTVIPGAYAESYRGYDYLLTTNEDGSYTKTFGLQPFIFNNNTNTFEPFINTNLTTETQHGSVELNNGVYSFYPSGLIGNQSPKFTDQIKPKYADITNLNNWTYLTQFDSITPIDTWDGSGFTTSKVKTGLGIIEYKYILNNNKWKTQLEATNLTPQNTKVFGFDQIINLNSDSIKFGGVTRNLDNFDGFTFDKQFLNNNQGKVIDLLNGFYFDFDLGFENLHSVTVYDTGVNSSQLVFDYRMDTPLLSGETLVIDPSYGDISGSSYMTRLAAVSGASCSTTGSSITNVAPLFDDLAITSDGFSPSCSVTGFEFDISGLPTRVKVTDTVLTYDVDAIAGTPYNCDLNEVSTQPSSLSSSAANSKTLFDDYTTGTQYVSSDATCTTAGIDKTIDLGASADTLIQTKRVSNIDWFAVSIPFDTLTRDATLRYSEFSNPRLSITYNIPPDPPKQFAATVTPSTGIDFTWLEGDANGSTNLTNKFKIDRVSDAKRVYEGDALSGNDYLPLQSNTAQYTIFEFGNTGNGGARSCLQFAMNGTIVPNLVSHFPLCYTPNDNGIEGNDGTVVGNELYTGGADDVGFVFDGSTYIDIPNESDYDWFENNTASSIGFTFQGTTGGNGYIVAKNGFLNPSWNVNILSDGRVEYALRDGSGGILRTRTFTGSPDFLDNVERQVFVTYDGSGSVSGVKIFVDGVLTADSDSSDTLTGSIAQNANVRIGNSHGTNQPTGTVKNVMIFNSTLDAHQIEQLYNEEIDTYNLALIGPPINDLVATATDLNTVDLSWTYPSYIFGTFDGFMINYTSPLGDPTIIITNNTESADTEYNVFGLAETTGYSFRVSTWNEFGNNASGNIANATTTQNFVIGNLTLPTDSNTNVVDISFTETAINSTATQLAVQFPNTFDLACDLSYQFAQTNKTYYPLTSTIVNSEYNSTYFNFTNVDNEIITIDCWNVNDQSQDGDYIITQTAFPILEQLANFRNGTYGTEGKFGVIDFITLSVIIFSMIGFNRVNESVGLIFNVALIGALGYFGIIEVPTIIFGAIAVVVMFTITSTRKT